MQAAFTGTALDRYVGPVHADIGNNFGGGYAADWACWQEAHINSAACADLYMNEIHARDSGIVLLHDPWGDAFGNTVDMTKNLVPRLKAEGYRFAMLEDVPAIAAYFPTPAVDAGGSSVDAGDAAVDSGGPTPVTDAGGVAPPADAASPAGSDAHAHDADSGVASDASSAATTVVPSPGAAVSKSGCHTSTSLADSWAWSAVALAALGGMSLRRRRCA